MMRIAVTTPAVLGMLKSVARPNNFVFIPLPFPAYDGKGTKREANFNVLMPFSKHREEWASTKAIDIRTEKKHRIHPGVDRNRRRKPGEIWVKTYGNIIGEYRAHPEAKFVGREGNPCSATTRGLIRPSHVVAAAQLHVIGSNGDDMSIQCFLGTETRTHLINSAS